MQATQRRHVVNGNKSPVEFPNKVKLYGCIYANIKPGSGLYMKFPVPTREFATSAELDDTVETFLQRLGGPCWIRVRGRDRSRVRALITLLHGNEPSGTRALHRFLRSAGQPATDILALVANVPAALAGPGFSQRMLPGRRDLNRCFAGPPDDDEGRLAREILDTLRAARPEALIDLHNTSGAGPAYGVGVRADPSFLALASLFASHYVLTDIRLGALMEATADEFPTVTVECGGAQEAKSDAVAFAGIEKYFCMENVVGDGSDRPDVTVIERPLRIRLADGATVAYAGTPVEGRSLTLRTDIDRFNSNLLKAGEPIGWARRRVPLDVSGRGGSHTGEDLFELRGGRLRARMPLRLFMATTDVRIAVADCLFYAVPL